MTQSFVAPGGGDFADLILQLESPQRKPDKVLKAALRCGTARPAMARSMVSLRKQQLLANPGLRLTA